MKKITLTLVAILCAVSMFANNDLKVSFCDNAVETIEEQQLLQCNELLVNSDDWKIISLSIGFMSGKDYVEVKIKGNQITKKITEKLKATSPEYLYIEQIVLINNKGEFKKLGAQKLLITK